MSDPTQANSCPSAAGRADAPAATASIWPEPLLFFTWPRIAKILVLAGLFFWLFHGTLIRLFLVWWTVPDWSHGLLIPFFSFGIFLALYPKWRDIEPKPNFWSMTLGVGLIVSALIFYVLNTYWWKVIMFQDYSWWLVLVGMVWALCGWRFLRAVWFPIFFICFSIRIGGILYDPMSAQLQQTAAFFASMVLKTFTQADLSGVVITLFDRSGNPVALTVAEACSGMKIMMAFMALGALMAYMAQRPWWHRLTLLLATVPIAIISNVFRVAGMGVLHYFEKSNWAEGFAHTLEGLLMLPIAFALFWLLHVILSHLVVEDEDENAQPSDPPDGNRREDAPAPPPPGLLESFIDLARAGAGRGPAALAAAGGHVARMVRRPGVLWADLKAAGRPLRPLLSDRHFLGLAGLLLVVAASWNVVNWRVGAWFIKYPVPLKQALDRFPREVTRADGTCWRTVRVGRTGWAWDPAWSDENGVLHADVEKTLGAKHPIVLRGGRTADQAPVDPPELLLSPQYFQRTYCLVKPGGLAPPDPMKVARFFVSYYTGQPDVVPHVPERCYLGGGYTENVDARGNPDLQLGDRTVNVRRVQFLNKSAFGGLEDANKANVIYFFAFNGQFSGRHLEVRTKLNAPLGKYAYYCKIEVQFPHIQDAAAHQRAAEELLTDFMPILIRDFLPDWSQYDK